MFMRALESLGKLTEPNFGYVKPDETVDLYFNLSKDGALDAPGPWNQEPHFKYVDQPTPQAAHRRR
jgi:Mn-containing catalase